MANTPQAEKRIRRNDRRAAINKTRVSRIRTFIKKVESAIQESTDPDLLATYRRDLVIHVRAVTEARVAALEALTALKEATADDADFEADAEEIEALQKKLTTTRDLLGDQIVKGKHFEDRAAEAIEKGGKDEAAAHREWDSIIAQYESAIAVVAEWLKNMRASVKDGEAAVKARDVAALAKARAGMTRFAPNEEVAQGKRLLNKTNDFKKKHDLGKFTSEFTDEIEKDSATVIGDYDKKSKASQDEGSKLMDAMDKLKIEPPDAVKATAKLGLKANFISRVGDALALDEAKIPKALEEVAKAGGINAKGKDLLDKLRKEKLYP